MWSEVYFAFEYIFAQLRIFTVQQMIRFDPPVVDHMPRRMALSFLYDIDVSNALSYHGSKRCSVSSPWSDEAVVFGYLADLGR